MIVSAGNTARRWTRCKLIPVCFVGYRLWKNCRVRPTVCKHTTHFITVITPLSARIPVLSTPLTYRELNLIELLLYSMRRERFVPSGSQRFLKEASSRLSRLMAVTYVRWLWRSRGVFRRETWGAARWEEGASPSLHLFTLSAESRGG